MMKNRLKVAAIFSNHMVLQRDKNVTVWGNANAGDKITVTLGDEAVSSVCEQTSWQVILPPLKAGGPFTMCITNEEESITFIDILIGDVWLAGGQSNMEFELQNSEGGLEEIEAMDTTRIRFYQVKRLSHIDEQFYEEEKTSHWETYEHGKIGAWSAVGYYFSKAVQAKEDLAIGIISCNWGGTSASAWVSKEDLEEENELQTYLRNYDDAMQGKTIEAYEKEIEEYNVWYENWQKEVGKLYEENPDILWSKVLEIAGDNRWPGPLGPKSAFRPAGLYETMLKRVCPYTLCGFLYYQGESDDHQPHSYAKLLTKLIMRWRSDWNDVTLPFLFVQLPMFIGREDMDKGNWPILREQQMKVYQTIKNTGIAVILECGTFDDIHPKNKLVVGERLALQALFHVYQKDVKAFSPMYLTHRYYDECIEVFFSHVEEGLYYQEDENYKKSRSRYVPRNLDGTLSNEEISWNGFEIAGEDNQFVPAMIEVQKECIKVYKEGLKNPKHVRYAYHNYSPVTIFNSENMPLACFKI